MELAVPVNTPHIGGNELRYLKECIESGWISSEGPFVKRFEEEFAEYIGCRFGISVANGSAALDIAVQALNIGKGDEVIMPAFTIISPALSIVRAGATPVLVDSCAENWTMDVSQIEARITSRTRAILVVHVYGIPADMAAIEKLARKYSLHVIEDAAEMIGQEYLGSKVGSFGSISAFSFYANKHVTTGEGGMLLTNDEQLAERCAKLRNLAFEKAGPRFVHYEMGWNYRMTNLQAAIGVAQLEQLQTVLLKKREIGRLYNQHLSRLKEHGYQLPTPSTTFAENIYWIYGIVAPDEKSQKAFTNHLTEKAIGWRPFFWSMHEQPVFQQMDLFKNQSFPVSERLARCGFYIPSGVGLNDSEQLRVCSVINEYCK